MNIKEKIKSIVASYSQLLKRDPTAASNWLEEQMNKLLDDEREELEHEMSLRNLPV